MTTLRHVNTTDIRAAIELGCLTMRSVFNADDHHIPFFDSQVRPTAHLRFHDSHSEAHVPGRHLDALLAAEHVLGRAADAEAIAHHTRAAFYSYSGPIPLPLNRTAITGPLTRFLPHNIREGFHALAALVAYRDSAAARQIAAASITSINDLWDPTRGWNRQRIEQHYGLQLIEWPAPFMTGIARAIGPLVKLYRATSYQPALELALVLKEKAIAKYFTADGQYDQRLFGTHVHSTTCVMSSLAQLAEMTGDAALLQRVKAFYHNGLQQISDALGWSIENSAPDAPPDRGEANNTGDILETALILARCDDPSYYHDAERILRGHLLPSQVRDTSFIVDPANPTGTDGLRAVAQRHLGAFGFPAPYGHQPDGVHAISFNMDIVGGAVASLCAAYRVVVHSDASGQWINLLFDHETAALRVESPYTHEGLTLYPKQPGPLYLRLPPWLDAQTIRSDGTMLAPMEAPYVCMPTPVVGQTIHLHFPLPAQEFVLDHRTHPIRVRVRGDQVVAIDTFGTDLTFFDPILS